MPLTPQLRTAMTLRKRRLVCLAWVDYYSGLAAKTWAECDIMPTATRIRTAAFYAERAAWWQARLAKISESETIKKS